MLLLDKTMKVDYLQYIFTKSTWQRTSIFDHLPPVPCDGIFNMEVFSFKLPQKLQLNIIIKIEAILTDLRGEKMKHYLSK